MDKTLKVMAVEALVFVFLSLLVFAWVHLGKAVITGEDIWLGMFGAGLFSFYVGLICALGARVAQNAIDRKADDSASGYAKLISGYPDYPNARFPWNDMRHWLPYSIRNPLWRSGCRTISDVQDKLHSGEHIDYIGEKRQAVCVAAVAEWERGLVKKTPCGA